MQLLIDAFAESGGLGAFIDTLVTQDTPHPMMCKDIWALVSTPGEQHRTAVTAIVAAFVASDGPEDLEVLWEAVLQYFGRASDQTGTAAG